MTKNARARNVTPISMQLANKKDHASHSFHDNYLERFSTNVTHMSWQNLVRHGSFMHSHLMLIDHSLSDGPVWAKFAPKRFEPGMLRHVEP